MPLHRYVRLMEYVFENVEQPKTLVRARAIAQVLGGEPVEESATRASLPRHHLRRWVDKVAGEGFFAWLKKDEPSEERVRRAKQGIAQMILATIAEQHFEHQATEALGAHGFYIEDDRVGRTDTDYRVIDRAHRPLVRINIKFHGTLFREAQEYVGLEPNDCFALAAYKIHGALRRQNEERLPYVFLVISVPALPREAIAQGIPDDLAWLAAISDRTTEEAIVWRLGREPWVDAVREDVRNGEFRVISARRASDLLQNRLFDRVHALRLRGFNRVFRGAEINMHLSLSTEMIPFREFLDVLATRGERELTVRLDRGEI